MSYLNHAINESPTIYAEAAEALTAPAMKAVAFDEDGNVAYPGAGAIPIGIVLADAADIPAGGRVNVQIKDICLALAGETIKRGDNLTAYTDGTVKVASVGDHIIGIALGAGVSGKPVEMMIVHICGGSAPSEVSLSDLTDVDLSTPATNGQVLKYDSSSSKWKAADDDLSNLSDVDLTTPATNGQVLKYDSSSSKWKAADDATT